MISNDLLEKRKALISKRIQNSKENTETAVISKRPIQDSIPFSFAQQRFWFMEQWEPGKATYNMPLALKITGSPNINVMEKALNEIISRHEILQMMYQEKNEEPQLIIKENPIIHLHFIELNKNVISLDFNEVKGYIDDEINRPFNLASELPIRAKLLQTGKEEYVFIIVLHHIAGDAWSVGILLKEFMALYKNYLSEEPVTLTELPIQYSDYAYWQKHLLSGDTYNQQLNYWKEIFKQEVPLLELPTDRPRPAIKTTNGGVYNFVIPSRLVESIAVVTEKESITTFMFLLAGLQILLQYYTGQNDITIGTSIAGRNRSELEELIGPFINTLVLRNDLSGMPTVHQLLKKVKDITLNALTNQDLPFEKLVEEIKPPRTLDRSPLFQVMMTFHNTPSAKLQLPDLDIEGLGVDTETAKFDLNFSFRENEVAFYGNVIYNTDLFNLQTIQRMVDHFINVLSEMVAHPLKSIHSLNILTQCEYDEMVVGWNNEQIEYPHFDGVHQLFERQVELVPNETAVVFENQKLTYSELNARSNQLAHYLRTIGVGPEVKVAIFMDRSIELMISILGVLKAGGAFVPLDPIYPSDRVQFILEDMKIPVMITHSTYVDDFACENVKILAIDKAESELFSYSPENPTNIITSDNLMYVLFTSGSTGRPKGVGIQHGNYLNYIHGLIHRLQLNQRLSYAIVSTFAADLGTTMIWGALSTGGELHIISYERAADPVAFRDYWIKNPIDVIKLVPSHFEMLQGQTYSKDILPRKYLIFAGEASHWSMIEKIKALNPICSIQNHYGPTETVVSMLTYPVALDKEHPNTFAIPLGKPIPNAQAYVLNEHLQPVPVGVLGELYVGGLGVSRGYLNRPDLTAEKFIPNPFTKKSGQRLYKTGDQVRHLTDGSIEFLDRVDFQVKIRGYRIELGEIESLLQKYSIIRDSIVIAREDIPGDKRLVAYLVLNTPETCNFQQSEIREYLRHYLPDYMIPSAFMILDKIPLNSNGKIDRAKLPVPEAMTRDFDNNYTAPQNELQIKIAAVWSEVLGIENIGIDENFFDLGGESFKAVRVVRKIDPSLSVISLFKQPTIRGIADLLVKDQGTNSDLLLELTKPVTQKDRIATLVCVPYGGGSAVSYQPLADALPDGMTLLAVEIPGHDLSRPDNPLQPLKDVARRCVDELKQKTNGSIALYGHCLGGALALEIARLLEADNIEVLNVFEAATFPSPRLPGKWFNLWSKLFPGDRWTSNRAYQDMLKSLGGLNEGLSEKERDFIILSMRHDFRQAEDYYTELYAYPPQKLKAPIISIVGEKDRMTEFYQERYHDWEHFSQTASHQVIHGSGHYFQKYQASKLADIITESIEKRKNDSFESSAALSELTYTEGKLEYRVQSSESNNHYVPPSMLVFLFVAFGQLISMVGSSLTSFSFGVWVYQQSGAVTDFALIGLAASLPGILALPLAGALADRYDRRKIMIICDTISALPVIVAVFLLWTNNLELWHIYIISSVSSIANSFQRPAYLAAVTQLVPKKYLGHANGLIQLATSTGTMLAPILGGFLVATIGLSNIILIDFTTFLFATTTLLVVRFPNTLFKKLEEPIMKEIVGGWKYILKRKPLVAMVVFFIIFNFFFSMTTTLLTPLILSFDSSAALGWVTGAAGFGGLAGSIIMSIWGGTKRRADGMVGFVIMTGVSFIILGWQTNVVTCIIGALGVWMSLSFINSHWQSLIQVKVGLELQGRIFATNQMLAWSCMPLGYVLIGPLVDRVFEPLMAKGEVLSNVFGWLIGSGAGRGMGLIMVLTGIILAITGYVGLKYRPLRYMEDILPDAIPDTVILDDKDALQEQADKMFETANKGVSKKISIRK